MKKKILLVSGIVPLLSFGFQVEEPSKDETYQVINGMPVVSIGDVSYSIYQIPNQASQYEITPKTDTHTELKAKLTLGEPVSKAEAIRVLEAYYKNTSFDFESIKIRQITVGEPTYAVWCANPWLMGCLEWQGAAGTFVQHEVNGKNRSGGMTGFQQATHLIRKFSSNRNSKDASPVTMPRPNAQTEK